MSFDFNGHFWVGSQCVNGWEVDGILTGSRLGMNGEKKKTALKKKQWFFGMRKQFPIVKVKCLKCNFADHYGNVL